jgi:hypothetical protein
MIEMIRAPGISVGWGVGWARERLTALIAAGPSMARFLMPDQLARLRASILRLDGAMRDKSVRGALENLAAALAAPRAPAGPPAETAAGSAEIVLESDGQGYSVPVRINGAVTVKFGDYAGLYRHNRQNAVGYSSSWYDRRGRVVACVELFGRALRRCFGHSLQLRHLLSPQTWDGIPTNGLRSYL